jgi:hypothetical protein
MKFTTITFLLSLSLGVHAGPLNFKSLDKTKLIKICSDVCGVDYTSQVEIRDFFQLKVYPDVINQSGLLCSRRVEWRSQGTPCHQRNAFLGIHMNGLAPEKTEIHRGSFSVEQGGAWCIAYNEDDFKGMKQAINEGKFKPGQVACMSGMTLESIKQKLKN